MLSRSNSRRLLAVLAALSVVLLAQPAAAGQLSWTYAPSNREAAGALGMGLRLYALGRDLRAGSIRQEGHGNSAGLAQSGPGQLGLIRQRGEGHTGTIDQAGADNAYALFQFGRGAEDRIVQRGEGGSGATVSYGW